MSSPKDQKGFLPYTIPYTSSGAVQVGNTSSCYVPSSKVVGESLRVSGIFPAAPQPSPKHHGSTGPLVQGHAAAPTTGQGIDDAGVTRRSPLTSPPAPIYSEAQATSRDRSHSTSSASHQFTGSTTTPFHEIPPERFHAEPQFPSSYVGMPKGSPGAPPTTSPRENKMSLRGGGSHNSEPSSVSDQGINHNPMDDGRHMSSNQVAQDKLDAKPMSAVDELLTGLGLDTENRVVQKQLTTKQSDASLKDTSAHGVTQRNPQGEHSFFTDYAWLAQQGLLAYNLDRQKTADYVRNIFQTNPRVQKAMAKKRKIREMVEWWTIKEFEDRLLVRFLGMKSEPAQIPQLSLGIPHETDSELPVSLNAEEGNIKTKKANLEHEEDGSLMPKKRSLDPFKSAAELKAETPIASKNLHIPPGARQKLTPLSPTDSEKVAERARRASLGIEAWDDDARLLGIAETLWLLHMSMDQFHKTTIDYFEDYYEMVSEGAPVLVSEREALLVRWESTSIEVTGIIGKFGELTLRLGHLLSKKGNTSSSKDGGNQAQMVNTAVQTEPCTAQGDNTTIPIHAKTSPTEHAAHETGNEFTKSGRDGNDWEVI